MTSAAFIIFNDAVAEPLIALVAGLLLDEKQAVFLTEDFGPAFSEALKDAGVKLGFVERFTLGLKFAGTMIKLLYAFVWQEAIIPGAYLENENLNRIGGEIIPAVNGLANALTGFPHSDGDLQSAVNVYPGDAKCRVGPSPHAKWHEQSSNGLMDLMYLVSDLKAVIDGKLGKGAAAEEPARSSFGDAAWLTFWTRYAPFDL